MGGSRCGTSGTKTDPAMEALLHLPSSALWGKSGRRSNVAQLLISSRIIRSLRQTQRQFPLISLSGKDSGSCNDLDYKWMTFQRSEIVPTSDEDDEEEEEEDELLERLLSFCISSEASLRVTLCSFSSCTSGLLSNFLIMAITEPFLAPFS